MSLAATTIATSSAGVGSARARRSPSPLSMIDDQDERDDGEEDPDEQDQPVRALQRVSPRAVSCDRWHHSSIVIPAAISAKWARTVGRIWCRAAACRKVRCKAARTSVSRPTPARHRPRVVRARAENETARRMSGGPSDECRETRARSVVADDAELVADLAAEEDAGDDGDDGDECEDECVFGEALAVLVVAMIDERMSARASMSEHGVDHLPPGLDAWSGWRPVGAAVPARLR